MSFPIPTGTTGQKQAKLRDIVCEIVKLAELYQCPIACENLDFSTKKNQLRHSGSKEYNRMLSGFVYDKFRSYLVVRAEKCGIGILFKSPFMTSVIGMVKYMAKYGLNSGSSAAMVIARRAMGFKEYIPQQWLKILSSFFARLGFKGWRICGRMEKDIGLAEKVLHPQTAVVSTRYRTSVFIRFLST